jgi:choline dehydrogenase-like flavoprotein
MIHYEPRPGQKQEIRQALRSVKRCLRRLGCIVPGPMVHIRPMGASAHYAGTLPMSTESKSLTVSPQCRSHDFANLYLADGSGFCFLPAKNYTFTLMANARRIAALIDQDQDAPSRSETETGPRDLSR